MLEMGFVVALGLIVTFCKLSWRARLRMLSYPVAMDVAVFVLVVAIHWGTFSGVMVASVAALFCSICLSIGRWAYGYIQNGHYVPGAFPVKEFMQ